MLDQSACVSTADAVGEGATVCRVFDLESHGTDWWNVFIDPLFAKTVHDILGLCPDAGGTVWSGTSWVGLGALTSLWVALAPAQRAR